MQSLLTRHLTALQYFRKTYKKLSLAQSSSNLPLCLTNLLLRFMTIAPTAELQKFLLTLPASFSIAVSLFQKLTRSFNVSHPYTATSLQPRASQTTGDILRPFIVSPQTIAFAYLILCFHCTNLIAPNFFFPQTTLH